MPKTKEETIAALKTVFASIIEDREVRQHVQDAITSAFQDWVEKADPKTVLKLYFSEPTIVVDVYGGLDSLALPFNGFEIDEGNFGEEETAQSLKHIDQLILQLVDLRKRVVRDADRLLGC